MGQFHTGSDSIDLVLYDAVTDAPLVVLDTKYKVTDSPSTGDIAQVMAYAAIKQCPKALPIYPSPLRKSFDEQPAPLIHGRSLTFALDGDLEAAGELFLDTLLPSLVLASQRRHL